MRSMSIAAVVNYVNTHKDYFGIKQAKATFSDCTGLFRMSKLSTKEMQLFRYCACDNTAEAFLPKSIQKADLKTSLNKTKNAKLSDHAKHDAQGRSAKAYRSRNIAGKNQRT